MSYVSTFVDLSTLRVPIVVFSREKGFSKIALLRLHENGKRKDGKKQDSAKE